MSYQSGKKISVLAATLLFSTCLLVRAEKAWPSKNVGRVIATGSLSVPRFDQTATLLPNGKVMIAGGMAANGVYHSTVDLYDPASGRFTPARDMGTRRSCHTATLLPNGKVLIAGGSESPGKDLASAELYDPATGQFTPAGKMTAPRCGAAAVLLRSGKVLLLGGNGEHEYDRLATAELYDPATGKFSATGSMRTPRDAHAAVLLKNGEVLVAGGSSAGRFPNETIEASAELYNPQTGKFTSTGNMKIPRYKLGAVSLDDGRALIVGGSDRLAWRGEYSSAELYDPASGTFTLAAEMNSKRYKLPAAVVRLNNGQILVAGGAERPEVYDPASGKFRATVGDELDGFCFSTATLLPDGKVLIAGGYGNDPGKGGVANAWIYQP
jgi:hypothetical protein